jgi:hypothetical protein
MTQETPSMGQQVSKNCRRMRVMALAYAFSGARPRVTLGVYREVLADATIKTVHFSVVATAFVFASILLTGVHP